MPKDVLLILTPGFPENEDDTTCLPTQQLLVRSLSHLASSVEIVVITLQYPYRFTTYNWHGQTVFAMGGQRRGKFFRVRTWWRAWQTVRHIRRTSNITGILSFWYGECAWLGKQFSNRLKIKHCCWVLGQDAREGNRFVRWANLPAEQIAAISDQAASLFFENYHIMPEYIVPNGIMPRKTEIHERDIDLLAAGSLIQLKRYDLYVRLVASLQRNGMNVRAWLCGDGPELQALQTLATSLGASITFAGSQPHHQLLALMQRTKLLIHPSEYEGFSTVCLEAITAGAQVISFIQPMNSSIEGWHVVQTIDEMIDKTSALMCKGQPLKHAFPHEFTIDETARKFLTIFNLIADGGQ